MTKADSSSWYAPFYRVNYPDFSLSHSWPYGIGISAFITFFVALFLLPPSFAGVQKWIEAFYFGLVTLVFYVLNSIASNYLFTKRVQEGKWRIYHHLLLTLWNFLTISIGNWALIWRVGGVDLSLSGFIQVILLTLLVGSIPIIGATLLRQNIQLRKQLLAAQQMEKPPRHITSTNQQIEIDDGKKIHVFDIHQLLFVEANRNYIEVYLKDQAPKQIRLSMKALGEQWSSQAAVVRCHRAFFIVMAQIKKVDGNAQGFQISLRDSDRLVPVSRTYIPAFKAKYQALSKA
ncbi:MAG: LytTR family DNA-binding domain-containing protein [Bacteroidota bacterium]